MGARFWGAGSPGALFPTTQHPTPNARELRACVAAFASARRRARGYRCAAYGLVVGGALAAIVGSAAQVFGIDGGWGIAIAALLLPVLLAPATGWLRPMSEPLLALELDRLLRLDERVTTALELATDPQPRSRPETGGPGRQPGDARAAAPVASLSPRSSALRPWLAAEQIEDALACLSATRPGAVYRLRLSRRAAALVAVATALAIAPWLVPWPAVFGGSTPASLVTTTNNAEAQRLESLAQLLTSDQAALDRPTRSQLAAQLRAAAAKLRSNGANGQQSTRDLLSSEQAVAASAPQTGENAALTLARIADALNNQAMTQGVTRALDRQDAAQAAAEMNQMAASLAQLSAQQRQDLANALQAASNAAQGSDTSAAQQLQQAADAARSGNPSGVQQASQALQQLGAASQAQRDVARAQAELQASRGTISQASQAGLPQLSPSASSSASSTDATQSDASSGSPSGSPAGGAQDRQSGGQQASDSSAGADGSNGSPGQLPNGSQANGQPGTPGGSSYGKGSADHVGASQDLQGLAQREVVVPSDQIAASGSISVSNRLQTGTGGTAQVDYVNVLPQYRQQALTAVENNAVPSSLQQVVKGYFDSLAPK